MENKNRGKRPLDSAHSGVSDNLFSHFKTPKSGETTKESAAAQQQEMTGDAGQDIPAISSDTQEGRRQRRFDSLARLLSLGSTYSACAAVTISEDELIIAANCADHRDSAMIAQLLQQRLVVLCGILESHIGKEASLALTHAEQANDYFAADIAKLKTHGGIFQTTQMFAQAIYKLCKSMSDGDDPDDYAFTDIEKMILLNRKKVTILVPAEKLQAEESGEVDLSDLMFDSPGFPQSSSAQSKSNNDSGSTLMLSPISKMSASNFLELSGDSFATTPYGAQHSAHSNKSPGTSFSRFWQSIEESSDSDSDANQASASSSNSSSGSDSGGDTVVAAIDAEEYVEPVQDYILNSLNESFSSLHDDANSSSADQVFAIRYVMNVYQNEVITPYEFPESIYQSKNKPHGVSGFHAEQLLAYYLKNIKNIDLRDEHGPVIPLGISKLCCNACTVLYHYPRLSIRGNSFSNFHGVPVLFPEAPPVPPAPSASQNYGSPMATQVKQVQNSPWS